MLTHRPTSSTTRCHAFTIALADRHSLCFTRHIRELSAAVRCAQRRRRFRVLAFTVLPDRVHCIWTLARADDAAACWAQIAEVFAAIVMRGERSRDFDRRALYQATWSALRKVRVIRDQRELRARIDRLHSEPVMCGLVTRPELWPWSTHHRAARMDWRSEETLSDRQLFERRA